MTDHAEHIATARTHLEGGDALAASRALRWAARTPDLHADPARLAELLGLWSETAHYTGYPELADLCEAAVSLEDQPLWDAAWELVEVGLSEVAIPLLRALVARSPEPLVIAELAVALRNSGDPGSACDVLLGAPKALAEAPVRSLLVECALAAGRIDVARRHLGSADELARGVLTRHDLLAPSLDRRDLRGWHFALTGGVLLHLSPYGFDEGMNGRYAYTEDSVERIRMGLERARAVMEVWGRVPKGVAGLGDRASQAVARAASTLWGVPLGKAGPDVPIVGYDLAGADEDGLATLEAARARGALVHVHSGVWTDPPALAPDTLTLLAQIHRAPWDAGSRIDPVTQTRVEVPASTESAGVWGERIASAEPWDASDDLAHDGLADLLAFARRAPPARGPRRFWEGGQVTSSRFL